MGSSQRGNIERLSNEVLYVAFSRFDNLGCDIHIRGVGRDGLTVSARFHDDEEPAVLTFSWTDMLNHDIHLNNIIESEIYKKRRERAEARAREIEVHQERIAAAEFSEYHRLKAKFEPKQP